MPNDSGNAVRLGLGLYGINPFPEGHPKFSALSGLKPVMEITSTVIMKKALKKGERVSYNGIFTAPKDMEIGVIPFGYYEGLNRRLSNNFSLSYGKTPLPIL